MAIKSHDDYERANELLYRYKNSYKTEKPTLSEKLKLGAVATAVFAGVFGLIALDASLHGRIADQTNLAVRDVFTSSAAAEKILPDCEAGASKTVTIQGQPYTISCAPK